MIESAFTKDASGFSGWADAVFQPPNKAELQALVARSTEEQVPITIAGARSGLTGGGVARGGWVVSLEKFRRLEIRSGVAHAGAGVSLFELQAAAGTTGQFYPPDPTEMSASVGGCIATHATMSGASG